MLLKRRVHVDGSGLILQTVPVSMVLLASSCAVNKGSTRLRSTAGRLFVLIAVKSPPRINEVGMLVALTRNGAKSHRRSYESKKNEFFLANGIGPLKEPPTSFKLKCGVGKVGASGV